MLAVVLFAVGLVCGGAIGALVTSELYENLLYGRMRRMDELMRRLDGTLKRRCR